MSARVAIGQLGQSGVAVSQDLLQIGRAPPIIVKCALHRVGDIEGLRWLRAQKLGAPIFADENIINSHDVAAHAGAVDGVIIKLMKTTGIREALRAIHTARALDMQIMLGCMVESSLGVTAAAHLAALCDYADLDGPLLIKNDPFEGLSYQGARLVLPDRPGLGARPKIIENQ